MSLTIGATVGFSGVAIPQVTIWLWYGNIASIQNCIVSLIPLKIVLKVRQQLSDCLVSSRFRATKQGSACLLTRYPGLVRKFQHSIPDQLLVKNIHGIKCIVLIRFSLNCFFGALRDTILFQASLSTFANIPTCFFGGFLAESFGRRFICQLMAPLLLVSCFFKVAEMQKPSWFVRNIIYGTWALMIFTATYVETCPSQISFVDWQFLAQKSHPMIFDFKNDLAYYK